MHGHQAGFILKTHQLPFDWQLSVDFPKLPGAAKHVLWTLKGRPTVAGDAQWSRVQCGVIQCVEGALYQALRRSVLWHSVQQSTL
jgi:hypothetical protein